LTGGELYTGRGRKKRKLLLSNKREGKKRSYTPVEKIKETVSEKEKGQLLGPRQGEEKKKEAGRSRKEERALAEKGEKRKTRTNSTELRKEKGGFYPVEGGNEKEGPGRRSERGAKCGFFRTKKKNDRRSGKGLLRKGEKKEKEVCSSSVRPEKKRKGKRGEGRACV